MKAAIMQPYFAPYLGYFQLIAAVDLFVVYDNIEYTRKGWINRNRILLDGREILLSIPLVNSSDFDKVGQKRISNVYERHQHKLLAHVQHGYRKAPFYSTVYPLVEAMIRCPQRNLFDFIFHSIGLFCDYLDIRTEILVSSTLPVDHRLKGSDKVIAICQSLGADTYINPIGGLELYAASAFSAQGIDLYFHEMLPYAYPQLSARFVPCLSIVDVLMHNSRERLRDMLTQYRLVRPPDNYPEIHNNDYHKTNAVPSGDSGERLGPFPAGDLPGIRDGIE